ncbi:MAG: S-adenosylmethionine:tRNA ribosyltransferase-isomerase [Muribaculaceae bacterium]|nr:S-adenosylmethionine:tRNA ribosyltransferase-isomerase [Muribaculaceae bacterium]
MISDPRTLTIDDFDYPLPQERIASHPLEVRDACKLLVRSHDGVISDHIFNELPVLLPDDTMLVYNNTRVINARLRFRKSYPDGALIEIFCLEPVSPADYAVNFASTSTCSWLCFVGNAKKWKQGQLVLPVKVGGREVELRASMGDTRGNARVITFEWESGDGVTFSDIIAAVGEIPIPPYLNRSTEESDSRDYQTVYSHIDGSVAAPTAGLHFTPGVLDAISGRGIPRRELTLHVGAGTFQPVKTDSIGEHAMHSEFIAVQRALIAELAATDRRVIAVGTTSVRTLESLYHAGCLIATGKWQGEVPQWYPYAESHPQLSARDALTAVLEYLDRESLDAFVADTRIIIAPGYEYRIVKGMVTNFHQPKSTLLLLVSALMGDDWHRVYRHALDNGYRFLSYGDACLFL